MRSFCRKTVALLLSVAFLATIRADDLRLSSSKVERLPKGAIQRLGTNRYRFPGGSKQLHFVSGGTNLVVCSETQGPEVIDATTGRRLHKAAPGAAGKSLLSVSRNGEIAVLTTPLNLIGGRHQIDFRLRRGKSGTALSWKEAPSARTRQIACSPDGCLLVTVSSLGHLTMRRISTGEVISEMRTGGAGIEDIDWSPDGRRIAFATRRGVVMWDHQSSSPAKPVEALGQLPVDSLKFSHNGQLLAMASIVRESIDLLNVSDGTKVLEIETGVKTHYRDSICFSPDDTLLYVPNFPGNSVDVYEVKSGKKRQRLDAGLVAPNVVSISSDGRWLAAAGNETPLVVWDVRSGERVSDDAVGHSTSPCVLKFSHDGRQLASGDMTGDLRVFDFATGDLQMTGQHVPEENRPSAILEIAFSPDGQWLASCGRDNAIRIWDLNTGEQVRLFEGHVVGGRAASTCLTFTSEGKEVLSFGGDSKLRRWPIDLSRDGWSAQLPLAGVEECAFNRDGSELCVRTMVGVSVFETQQGNYVAHSRLKTSRMYNTMLMPDRGLVIGSIKEPRPNRVLFPADAPQGNILFWQNFSGAIMPPQTAISGGATAMCFSMNGERLAVCCNDATGKPAVVTIADVKTGQAIARFRRSRTSRLALSPDGRYLATSHDDTSILVWDVSQLPSDN